MAFYWGPHEDLARRAIAIYGTAEDPAYPAANLIAEDPARTAKLTAATGAWILEFAEKVAPIAAALIYQYLDEGLNVEIQGNDTDVWTSPAFVATIPIPAKRFDGPTYQKWTINPWSGIFDDLPDPAGYLFWRLAIHGTNSQAVAIGRLSLPGAVHQVTLFQDPNLLDGVAQTDISQLTELDVENVIIIGGPRRPLDFLLLATDLEAGSAPHQDAADFRELIEASEGRAHPFFLVPFEDNDVMCSRTESHQQRWTHEKGGYQRWDISIREVSRGLPWP